LKEERGSERIYNSSGGQEPAKKLRIKKITAQVLDYGLRPASRRMGDWSPKN